MIVEPFAGSAGVVIPPVGYLQRLREICTANNILLIFDEVITGFGRVGAYTGAEAFGVTPDILNLAKQVTNGDAAARRGGREEGDLRHVHGGRRPRVPARVPARLHVLRAPDRVRGRQRRAGPAGRGQGGRRVKELAPYFENAVHGLKGRKHVTDIRNFGLAAGLTIDAVPGEPAKRPFEIAMKCLDKGMYVRYGGDTIQLAPPFIVEKPEIDRLISVLADALDATA